MRKIFYGMVAAMLATSLHGSHPAIGGAPSAPSAPAPASITDITVDSRCITSPAKVTVVLPEGYDSLAADPYPVVYLLNGHGGNNRSWSTVTRLDSLATEFDMIFVCPDGRNSWYWDSPVDSSMQMESYIVGELVPYIDSHYRTRADRTGRAITGLSMGGHGALWIGVRHSDMFANVGSTSGGVDIVPFPKRWNMADHLGSYAANKDRWRRHSVMAAVDTLSANRLNIIFDCGKSDFFFKVNNTLDSLLTARGIQHTYLTSPGAHTPQYWARSILPQLEFFHRQFSK